MKNNRKGISLIELMVIIGIVVGTSYMLAPLFKRTSEAEAINTGKDHAIENNKALLARVSKLFQIRTSGATEGVMLDAASPFFIRFQTLDPTGTKTRQNTYRTVCQSVTSPLNLHTVEGDFCGGSKSLSGCGPGNRMAIELTYDPDTATASDEKVESITPPFSVQGSGGERRIIAQVLCAKSAASLTGIQSVPLNNDIRLEIATAYVGTGMGTTNVQVRWEKAVLVLPVRARDVSSIEILDTR